MNALTVSTTCRHCAGTLTQVNAGHADGAVSSWVGRCTNCRYQWVIRATMTPLGRMQGLT